MFCASSGLNSNNNVEGVCKGDAGVYVPLKIGQKERTRRYVHYRNKENNKNINGIRLNKALRELNMGLQTAVEFLEKKSELGRGQG